MLPMIHIGRKADGEGFNFNILIGTTDQKTSSSSCSTLISLYIVQYSWTRALSEVYECTVEERAAAAAIRSEFSAGARSEQRAAQVLRVTHSSRTRDAKLQASEQSRRSSCRQSGTQPACRRSAPLMLRRAHVENASRSARWGFLWSPPALRSSLYSAIAKRWFSHLKSSCRSYDYSRVFMFYCLFYLCYCMRVSKESERCARATCVWLICAFHHPSSRTNGERSQFHTASIADSSDTHHIFHRALAARGATIRFHHQMCAHRHQTHHL